ncbi:MAG: phosphohistidine phosphatase SixA [Deltaproteobacteria bacterium]|nr:phosphohistidine phosphatase SixA [Deltaproteobacteria bacterium]
MALYLVQHGKSLPKDQDPDQNLSEEGISVVEAIAERAAEWGITVSSIRHSGKRRARETAELIGLRLNPENGLQEQAGLNPLDDVSAVARDLTSDDNLMLVGHLPFMEKLTAYLIIGTTEPLVFKFQNGGIVCLDQDPETKKWFITGALQPTVG